MSHFQEQQDDLDERTEAVPQTRCAFCEQYFDKPNSNAKAFDKFCSEFCEEESANAERIR